MIDQSEQKGRVMGDDYMSVYTYQKSIKFYTKVCAFYVLQYKNFKNKKMRP